MDDGNTRTEVSAAAEQVYVCSETHNVNVATLYMHSQRQELTPEFLAHLSFNHCGDEVMKLMRQHSSLYDLNLGRPGRVVGQVKHCGECLVPNKGVGARAAYNNSLTKVATSPGQCFFADVTASIHPLGTGDAKYVLAVVESTFPACHANA